MDSNLFFQISALLTVTVAIAFIIRFLKQPLLVSYMIAGIVCGPLFFNLLSGESNLYQAFSDFGVVLLLFIVGLELNFSYLKKIGRTSVIVGFCQFILNFSFLFFVAIYYLGLNLSGAVFLSLAACFSSTIVILKLLNDKRDEESVYGRYTIGLMLIQDLISIAILFFLSIFSVSGHTVFDVSSLMKIGVVAIFIFLNYKFILPMILDKIASSSEFLFIFTVAWCFCVASLTVWAGFSLELGAIIAGLSLGSSRYRPEIISRIKPLRDFFIVIFFVILGSMADFSDIESILIPALILSFFIIMIKPLILYLIFRVQKFTRRNSFLSGTTAIPLSEFGFIILLAAAKDGYLHGAELSIFTIATIVTIFVSSYLISYNAAIYNFFRPVFLIFGRDKNIQREKKKETFKAIVFGYHRTGWKIGEALKEKGLSFAAVDFNPENVARLKDQDIRSFFGDSSDVEFLKILPLEEAKFIISTIPSPEDQLVLINYIRSKNKKNIIIGTLYNKKYLNKLYEAGADYVILPHLLSGVWLSKVISKGTLSDRKVLKRFRHVQGHELEGNLDPKKIAEIISF